MPVESRQVGLTKAQFVEATDAMFLKWLEKYLNDWPYLLIGEYLANEKSRVENADCLIKAVKEARRRIVRLQNEVEL